jgi:hypothetical protein
MAASESLLALFFILHHNELLVLEVTGRGTNTSSRQNDSHDLHDSDRRFSISDAGDAYQMPGQKNQ